MDDARSLSLAGIKPGPDAPWGGSLRSQLAWAAALGYRAVQIDLALPGLRPRELDRSARLDLGAVVRRSGLTLSGVDLWIPKAHFVSGVHAERAIDAVRQALELAGELARMGSAPVPVCGELGPEAAEARGAIAKAAERAGVVYADHAWPVAGAVGGPGVGIDPAAVIAHGADPVQAVLGLADVPVAARLSDLSSVGRVPPGEGRLDVLAYSVALRTRGFVAPIVVDLRGLVEPAAVAAGQRPAPGL